MSAMRSIPTLCSAGLRILVMIALLTMGCRTWGPGWFADRRGEPGEPAVPSPQFVDEPAVAPGPAVVGRRLGLRPGETAAERALHLTEKLAEVRHEQANAERERVAQLQERDQELFAAIELVQQATAELERAKTDIKGLEEKLNDSNANAKTLRTQLEEARAENENFLRDLLKRLQNGKSQAGAAGPDAPTAQ